MNRVLSVATLFAVGCGGKFDQYEAFAGCSSEMQTAEALVSTNYDSKGWPVTQTTDLAGVVTSSETTYERIAGSVRTGVTEIDGGATTIITYDAHQHIEMIETENVDPIVCDNTHDGEVMTASTCGEVETTYDAECGLPVRIAFVGEEFGEDISNFIDACERISITAEGEDSAGPYSRGEAFQFGRPVATAFVQGAVSLATVTSWDCPEL